ncbi:unnamed protein product [Heligmosomoides polygyrus]|uniref:Transposase n=1 Tax=Heligmosomoides polygyrus TaxID=6339 RepID=A0A183FXZ0_HELPZ|nr:unnamed protein product [Heligmosomoides polygyrus]
MDALPSAVYALKCSEGLLAKQPDINGWTTCISGNESLKECAESILASRHAPEWQRRKCDGRRSSKKPGANMNVQGNAPELLGIAGQLRNYGATPYNP